MRVNTYVFRGLFAAAVAALGWAVSAQAASAAGTALSFSQTTYTVPPYGAQASAQPESLAVADFNRDGKPDVAALDLASGAVDVFLNKGNGHFGSPPKQFSSGCLSPASPGSLTAGDFNRDGKADLFLLCNGAGVFMPGNGKGGFGKPLNTNISGQGAITVGDVDGDGPDLEYLGYRGQDFCYLDFSLLRASGGTPLCSTPPSVPFDPYAIAAGRFGSGKSARPVALAYSEATGKQTLHIFSPLGGASFAESDRAVGGANARSISLGDLNGDHNADVVMGNFGTKLGTGSVSVYVWNATKGIPSGAKPANYPAHISIWKTVLGDFNRDGHVDVAAAGYGAAGGAVAVLPGTGKGSFQTPRTFAVPGFNSSDGMGTLLATSDFNHDGKPDLVVLVNTGITVLLNTTH